MTRPVLRSCLLLAAASSPAVATATEAQPQREQVIVVTAPRQLPVPDRLLEREDIDSYGAGSIGELLTELLDEEGEQSPVVLINGKRASGLEELSDYPPEALARVEVLPVGSGPSVGASPTRKVVNLVLERRFDGTIGRAAVRTATEGGWRALRGEGTQTLIRGDRRLNFSVKARQEDALLESERDVLQPTGSLAGEVGARSLLPSVIGTDLSLSGATPLGAGLDLSATGRLSWSERESRFGLLGSGLRLEQETQLLGGRFNTSLNAELGGWTLALLGNVDADRRRLEGLFEGGAGRTLVRNAAADLDLTAVRPLFELPAGPLQLNLGAGLAAERLTTRIRRSTIDRSDTFTERSATFSGGLVVPIAGGAKRVLAPLGELTLSLDAGLALVGDGETFLTRSAGLVWQPLSWLRLTGGLSEAVAPPAARYRREAVLEQPGVLVFDPLTGTSVRVTEIGGPLTDTARARTTQQRLALSLSPRSPFGLRLDSEWNRRRDRDIAGDLPAASAAVLAAFPERFIRDASGTLTAIDVSPLLFARRDETVLRNSLNLRFFLGGGGSQRAQREERGDDEAPRGARPRLLLSLAHTLLLSSRLTLREGLAPVDLLSRRALLLGAARPRHQFDLSANLSKSGMGLRVTADHRSASTTAIGGTDLAPETLSFGALTTFSLRAFAEADRLFGRHAWARGTRLSLALNNVANAREQVRDDNGNTPLAFQPAFRDPLGRTIELEVRRRF